MPHYLQYCLEIKHADITVFPSLDQTDSTDQSLLYFPALCSADKAQVPWVESVGTDFSIGWLAECTHPFDFFPPRFLHVLLLRLVFRFALSAPVEEETAKVSSEYSRRCTMWKKGVHWITVEGVDCMVELVGESKQNKAVVVLTKSSKEWEESCVNALHLIISCVMEAKVEFCHSIRPHFFLLDSTAGIDSKDNIFAMSDVEKALSNKGSNIIVSVSGRGKMRVDKLQCMRRFTLWNNLFPIDASTVLHHLQDIVKQLFQFGESLGVPLSILQTHEVNFPNDVYRRKTELVRWWISSSSDQPCWWHLVQALKRIDENALAEKIRKEYAIQIQLQEKILDPTSQEKKPDETFLQSLSSVVGSKWPSLAECLAVSAEELRETREGASPEDLACWTLGTWVMKEKATYGQLCNKLKAITFFQNSK